MSKLHAQLKKMMSQEDVPLWQVVQKEGPTWFKHTNTLCKPAPAPGKVVSLPPKIICALAVLCPEIEWRISKDHVNNFVPDGWKNFHAIIGPKRAKVTFINRRRYPGVIMEEWRFVKPVRRPPK